ncbi:MAG: cytidine deaminase [Elusimicrobiota bacterium]
MNKKSLVEKALGYRKSAYAPYSGFKVGAAVEGESKKVYGACNVENFSYGLSICAERNAIGRAVGEGEKKIKQIAIATSFKNLSYPCGACLQVMAEFALEDFEIICAGEKGEFVVYKLKELLPYGVEIPLKRMLFGRKDKSDEQKKKN